MYSITKAFTAICFWRRWIFRKIFWNYGSTESLFLTMETRPIKTTTALMHYIAVFNCARLGEARVVFEACHTLAWKNPLRPLHLQRNGKLPFHCWPLPSVDKVDICMYIKWIYKAKKLLSHFLAGLAANELVYISSPFSKFVDFLFLCYIAIY